MFIAVVRGEQIDYSELDDLVNTALEERYGKNENLKIQCVKDYFEEKKVVTEVYNEQHVLEPELLTKDLQPHFVLAEKNCGALFAVDDMPSTESFFNSPSGIITIVAIIAALAAIIGVAGKMFMRRKTHGERVATNESAFTEMS